MFSFYVHSRCDRARLAHGSSYSIATSTSAENSKVSVISPRSAASPTSLSPPVAPFAPQIDLYVDPQEVVPKYKKEGPDWFVIFNPEATGPQRPDNQLTKSLDVQLVHSLAHLRCVCHFRVMRRFANLVFQAWFVAFDSLWMTSI